jgi:hypothetical protein
MKQLKKVLKKLQLEVDEKNVLKDKLTQAHKMLKLQLNDIAHLVRVQQTQQRVIDEYKIMIESFK